MKILKIISTTLQILAICVVSFSLGFSKYKLLKQLLYANIFLLIINIVLVINKIITL